VPRYPHAVLGGTFDHFHVGHAALLDSAFQAGYSVSVGVTTDRFVSAHPKPFSSRIQPYARRRRAVLRWVRWHYPRRTVRLVPLANPFGRSVEDGVDVLVVSADTLAGGRAVNDERRRLGRRPVPLRVVPVVLADDLGPVSSRRIRSGEIDRFGRRLAPLRVGVGVADAEDRHVVARAVRAAFPSATVVCLGPAMRDRRTETGTLARKLARRAVRSRELALGVARAAAGGWQIVERTPNVELRARSVPRGSQRVLFRALSTLLRPRLGRKAFGPPRP